MGYLAHTMRRLLKRPGVWVVAGLVLTAAAVLAQRARGPLVQTVEPRRQDLEQHIVSSGRVRVPSRVQLAAQVPGRVLSVGAVAGQRVKAGDVLAQLDDSAERAAVASAEAAVKQAQARVEQLTRVGAVVATQSLRQAETNLEKAQAELAALIGPSGSGKSTLLNIIGLLDRPTEGRVLLDGVDTSTLDERGLASLRARALGFVFQFHHLLPAFTALENVMLPAWGDRGYPSDALRAASEQMLREVGLGERLGYRVTNLSGGQQQRVAIARALVHRPRVVLADEPTGNLDTESSDEVFALMRRFNRELGTTVLVVTHDPRIAARCERVVELVDGRVRSDRRT